MCVRSELRFSTQFLVCAVLMNGAGPCEPQVSRIGQSTAAESLSPETRSLIEKSQEASAEDRAATVVQLREMGHEGAAAIPFLIDLLNDTRPVGESESVATVASAALAQMGKLAAEACLAALIERRAPAQSDMLRRTIGQFTDEDAINVFLGHMTDSDPKIRNTTVISVMYSTDPRLVPALIDCFKDGDRFVRLSAVGHFRNHRDARAVEPLIDALSHQDETMRTTAAEALGIQDDRRAIAPLLARIHDHDERGDVQRIAAEALGKIGGPVVFDSLLAVLAKAPDFTTQRPGAGQALNYHGEIVSRDLTGRRFGAVRALGHLGDPRAGEILRSVLRNGKESEPVRLAAAKSLAEIEGKHAFPLMTEFATAQSESPVFRFGIAVELVNASNGAIDELEVVAALTGWTHYGWYHAKVEGLKLAIAALESVADRGNTQKVRSAAVRPDRGC
jgi:HEAT repeat protein